METFGNKAISALLVRDLCTCDQCRHPGNGQRLRSVLDLAPELEIIAVQSVVSGSIFTLSDGHDVHLDAEQTLKATNRTRLVDLRSESSKYLWDSKNLDTNTTEWEFYLSDPKVKLQVLRSVEKLGFAILTGLPTTEETVLDVIETFGYIRTTNYGKLFDVRVEENPNNLAFTSFRIAPHTDNPYRDPVPTLQLLHCLATNVEGGNSGLIDGFQVAHKLRTLHPEAFELLTTHTFKFTYTNPNTHLECVAPIIRLNSLGEVVGIKWNDRSMQSPEMSEDIDQVFSALKKFAEIANDPSFVFEFRLEPGDCVIFDNTRLLHSRTAFSSLGTRHLQGAYSDIDSLLSTSKILENEIGK